MATNIPPTELQALEDLYHATNGDEWTWHRQNISNGFPWNFSAVVAVNENPCTKPWQAVVCLTPAPTDLYYHVSELLLVDYNLHGTISESLNQLQQLNNLQIAINPRLVGTIPSSLSELSQLQHLALWTNQLTGTIPPSVGNLSQ